MNLYSYDVLYLAKHQDLLAATEERLAKLAQKNLTETKWQAAYLESAPAKVKNHDNSHKALQQRSYFINKRPYGFRHRSTIITDYQGASYHRLRTSSH